MSRERILIVVLLALLGVSLFFNFRWWQRSRQTGSAAVAASAPEPMSARATAPRERGERAQYEVVANPELKGRLGRIVLGFAEGVKLESTRTAFYQAGKSSSVRTGYGAITAEMMPGSYDIEVNGKKLADIPVEAGKDTRIRSGALRLHGSPSTRFVIYEAGAAANIHVAYGNAEFGLPAGEYEVEVNDVREKITIEPGKVTDF
jgi:hypothetical protein